MKRFLAACLCLVAFVSCRDDRVRFSRGPLGPASYEVMVTARNTATKGAESHRATLRVEPRRGGAQFDLRSGSDRVTAELRLVRNGSVDLTHLRGGKVQAGRQTELASLVGQLNPPLPPRAVRLGQHWSSTQRITTQTLSAALRTQLRMVRFRRVAATDAAEFVGTISGQLRVSDTGRILQGRLTGDTTILWAVRAGRVVSATTNVVWTLSDGNRVTLSTSVTPR